VYLVKQYVTYCYASWLIHGDYTPVIASAAKQSPYECDFVQEIATLRSQ